MKQENSLNKTCTVIGAGLGGLAAASLLASKGYNVSVYEKNQTPGGKMQQIEEQGYRFDSGPSLLTMPFLLEQLFNECGEDIHEYITLTEPTPLCRYFYKDGTLFDNYADRNKTISEINKFAPEDADAYSRFLDRSKEIYDKTSDAFLFNPLYEPADLKGLKISDFLGIDAFSTVSNTVDSTFSSSYLRKFFKRFTTYNGSSPYRAPATLNVIPHVELNLGGYYVSGGLYGIANSLYKLAVKKGVTFHFNTEVASVEVINKSVKSIILADGSQLNTELLVANADASDFILNILPNRAVSSIRRKRQKYLEPSCSGFVLMLGCNKSWDILKHHNIFFSSDYKKEFSDIFEERVLPDDPTIYIANTSYTNQRHAPGNGSNLFILVNSPYLTESQNWNKLENSYSEFLVEELENRGLDGLNTSIEFQSTITPKDFLKKYGSNKGSIYGTSSNSKLSAFIRPRNKLRGFDNVYLVGGSTHPGGGIPLVIQSAFNAIELIGRTQ